MAALAAALLLAGAHDGQAGADESHTGDLLAVRLIGGVSSFGDTTATNAGTIVNKHSEDLVGTASIALGYDWSKKGLPFRSELEYGYRFRFDYDLRVLGGTNSDFEQNVSSHVVMANVYYDFDTDTRLTPYLGFGIGWARHVSESEQIKLIGSATESREDETDNFAWSLQAGILWRLGQDWRAEAAYRYVNLGETANGPFGDGTRVENDSYTSHDIVLGIVYAF